MKSRAAISTCCGYFTRARIGNGSAAGQRDQRGQATQQPFVVGDPLLDLLEVVHRAGSLGSSPEYTVFARGVRRACAPG
jgi:hypothetical protein